jgi:hypothetical protein
MRKLVDGKTSVEYFKDLVERAIERQGVASSELSSYYLVQLLDSFVSLGQLQTDLNVDEDVSLAELMCEALQSAGERRLLLFRFTGDLALFLSGFFADNILRRRLDLEYYERMGGYAYRRAAHLSHEDLASVFCELAMKFGRFVDVLSEVSEESSLNDSASVLRLYERWRQTGSRRSESLLRQQGILVHSAARQLH